MSGTAICARAAAAGTSGYSAPFAGRADQPLPAVTAPPGATTTVVSKPEVASPSTTGWASTLTWPGMRTTRVGAPASPTADSTGRAAVSASASLGRLGSGSGSTGTGIPGAPMGRSGPVLATAPESPAESPVGAPGTGSPAGPPPRDALPADALPADALPLA